MPRAYDLIGDVTEPSEIFPRLGALEAMVTTLRERGLHDAADDTAELLEEARTFAGTMNARSGRLRRIWKAVEMASEPVTDTTAATRDISEAALDYRAVRD
jgi:ABC-type transporter Mla subunit MlaD